MTTNDDVLILGSGIAALQLASLLNKDLNVRILTKDKIRTANSYLAQGGIAAAIGEHDHPTKHIADTFEAGRYHNNQEAVEQIIRAAPRLIKFISEQGSVFDKNQDGELLLGMEGAHSEKRIVHGGGDATGKNVVEFLISTLKENVTIEEEVYAYELLMNSEKRCIGVKAKMPEGAIKNYYSKNTILATGGCGQLFTYTSNADTVSGDGIAMAYLAGAEIVDMEFIQFHPTLLYLNGETRGLISEAVRGEGAVLVTEDGNPIMEGVHPLKDLGPRHVVSQKIYEYLKKGCKVYLDISKIENFKQRFPSITAICEDNGLQLSEGRIPVAPGSHFLMGGIKTDLFGRTSIKGLYAIGEAACTGLHGANRLASNSLLEGLYMGEKLSSMLNEDVYEDILWTAITCPFHPHEKVTLPDVQEIKDTMMERVGIVRNEANLQNQKVWLDTFKPQQINNLDLYSVEEITKIFMLIIATLITEAALQRTESRGGHFRSDYPMEDDHYWLNKTIIHKISRGMESNHEYIETALAT
ncbi:L-aspartate oxidase [Neobacillus niacini]|uniref:L-aspartate oxidase n=1 Tax=Neobacillus niacini TaxID=86668 RepID=UPI00052FCC44|nr:L-aspartate oxidase [Neobacillus niacini]KGM45530.1 L-aspartate oxidase [Neobacillus niacini]MEC1521812.1 L-aspartate oxidase [Neobacillus niacini]